MAFRPWRATLAASQIRHAIQQMQATPKAMTPQRHYACTYRELTKAISGEKMSIPT